MRNLRNIFKEYNDPRIYRSLKIGFTALIVLGVLTAFIISPDFLHKVGIGNNEPVPVPKESNRTKRNSDMDRTKRQGQRQHQSRGHQEGAEPNSKGKEHNPLPQGNPGSGGVSPPSSEGGGGPAPVTPQPTTPTPTHPTENNPSTPPSNDGGGGDVDLDDGGSGVTTDPGRIGIEVEVPGVTTPPLVEEATNGVSEVVNGVTGSR